MMMFGLVLGIVVGLYVGRHFDEICFYIENHGRLYINVCKKRLGHGKKAKTG